ncbi:aminoacyl-tRNA hydrolase [Geopsychrobacter electrodiphilus]|uniref:aminoacyl-tRNA hydrolase n=1 Tax=Geopsychrobacter electrodiphilus TaxID=225196 RepID=UPI00036F0807|nr:aminoacyl-tRNA hydrolase [Geopsychrobacter electrodiphilus]
MKLLVGLGNPGENYQQTRHNVGFMLAAEIAGRFGISLKKKGYQGLYGVGRVAGVEATVLLPQTFMNLSGASVNAAYQSLGVSPGDLIVAHDDLDMPFGALRIRPEGGHGGHNGIRSICGVLGRGDFIRVKIGIGRPEHGDVTGHVLGRFSTAERSVLPALLQKVADATEEIFRNGVKSAMNLYNSSDLLEQIKP